MKAFLLILGILVGGSLSLGGAIYLLIVRSSWKYIINESKTEQHTKMTWEQVKSLYPINPEKWVYEEPGILKYKYIEEETVAVGQFQGRTIYKDIPRTRTIFVYLSFKNFVKLQNAYYKYTKEKEAREMNSRNIQGMEAIINDVKIDINKAHEKAQECIEQAREEMRKAVNK